MSTDEVLNCFVIMPFDESFDDVYTVIKSSVESCCQDVTLKCFRIDESRPAGRITHRLLGELADASVCIGDLTGLRPNVMWEVGYAMALGKHMVIITQQEAELPFDLKDMQRLQYDRGRLTSTLRQPLTRVVQDTIAVHMQAVERGQSVKSGAGTDNDAISSLTKQVADLTAMLKDYVRLREPETTTAPSRRESGLERLEGAWLNRESDTHLYARVINGQLFAPYCYGGNNRLVAMYYDWANTGDYWFARFQWVRSDIAGFAFIRQDSDDSLTGRWWYKGDADPNDGRPDDRSGIPISWRRVKVPRYPDWAESCFDELQHGRPLAHLLDARPSKIRA